MTDDTDLERDERQAILDAFDAFDLGWRLVKPAPHHAPTVASWSVSAAEAEMWVAHAEDPFSPKTVAGWWEADGVDAWVLNDAEGIAVAYAELWDSEVRNEVELARLIVDPERRRTGIGRRMVDALVGEAGRSGRGACVLRLVRHNSAARALCLAGGFVEIDRPAIGERLHRSSSDHVWMQHPSIGPAVQRWTADAPNRDHARGRSLAPSILSTGPFQPSRGHR